MAPPQFGSTLATAVLQPAAVSAARSANMMPGADSREQHSGLVDGSDSRESSLVVAVRCSVLPQVTAELDGTQTDMHKDLPISTN